MPEVFYNLSLVTLGRFLLGIVFAISSISKWHNRDRFTQAISSYRIISPVLTPFAAIMITWLELLLAMLLIFNYLLSLAALLTALLLSIFTIAQVITLVRGQHVDCHCFGQSNQEKVGLHTVVRNVALVLVAAWILLISTYRTSLGESVMPVIVHSLDVEIAATEQILLFFVALSIWSIYFLAQQTLGILMNTKKG